MIAQMLTTNSVIKQEPFALKSCSSVLQDARQATENNILTINASVMTHSPYSLKTPVSATWEGGVQLQSVGTVHQNLQYYPWQKELIRSSLNTTSDPVRAHSKCTNISSSGTVKYDYRMLPPEKIKREEIGKAVIITLLSLCLITNNMY